MLTRPIFRSASMACLAALTLTGCSALSALDSATRPLEVYELDPPAGLPPASGQLARDVVVELPAASGALSTDRIMVRPAPLQAQYLPDARWADELPVMVQTLLVRSLEGTGGLRYVGRRPLAASGDYAILTEITEFQAETVEGGDGASMRVEIVARIIRESDASVLSTRRFAGEARAEDLDTPTLVSAFDAASDSVMDEMTRWILARLGRPLPS